MPNLTRAEATQKIASYQAQLKTRRPDMADDFAEGLASYMVLHGITRPNEARKAVWLMGESGLETLRAQVAAL